MLPYRDTCGRSRVGRGRGEQHEAQVRLLGDAALRVLARDGLPGLTFRTVATEASVSPGRVQHYARSSAGLLALTFQRIRELTAERVREAATSLPSPAPADVVEATLLALIPQGERDRTMLRVAAAVELQALTDPERAEELRGGRAELIGFLADQLARLPEAAAADPRHLTRTATALLATAEGLSTLTLTNAIEAGEARQTVASSIRAFRSQLTGT